MGGPPLSGVFTFLVYRVLLLHSNSYVGDFKWRTQSRVPVLTVNVHASTLTLLKLLWCRLNVRLG